MKNFCGLLSLIFCLIAGCSEVSKEKAPLVAEVNEKVRHIDSNHRVKILEDDFHKGDSIYKIRGYFMEGKLLKLVGVLYTSHVERDDYFYFESKKLIFSGHLVVARDDQMASEYKYYYGKSGFVDEALFWTDKYQKGRQFPHERFKEFNPDVDSLKVAEDTRLQFFMDKLDMEGFEIHGMNENRGANN